MGSTGDALGEPVSIQSVVIMSQRIWALCSGAVGMWPCGTRHGCLKPLVVWGFLARDLRGAGNLEYCSSTRRARDRQRWASSACAIIVSAIGSPTSGYLALPNVEHVPMAFLSPTNLLHALNRTQRS